jgi:hypothetical protein
LRGPTRTATCGPDAYRWQRPDQVDDNAPSYLRKFRADRTHAAELDRDAAARADAEVQEQRLALARLRLDWELLKFVLRGRKAGFNPDQPRVPAGQSRRRAVDGRRRRDGSAHSARRPAAAGIGSQSAAERQKAGCSEHREIGGWFRRPNAKFRNEQGESLSPEQYLRGKDWDERGRVGIDALIEHRVLKP